MKTLITKHNRSGLVAGRGSPAGKGDADRPVDYAKFNENFDNIKWAGVSGGQAAKDGYFRKTYQLN